YSAAINGLANPWAPFSSRIDWEIAKWAKLCGAGSTAFSDLLAIEGVHEALQLSYKNSNELNCVIDKKLPGHPAFQHCEVIVAGEVFELFCRNIIECIKALWGDVDFAEHLLVEHEQHYVDVDQTIHLYFDMHTGKWWWCTQRELEAKTGKKGCTIILVIISSDKTQLTVFRGKSAYPVYMTIGNLPKYIRHKPSHQGQVLLAYLPISKLNHIKNKSACCHTLANLFHACMKYILKPLETAGIDGVHMTSGDGIVQCCHLIYATFVGDYPEQLLITAVKTGQCPTCPADNNKLGDPASVGAPCELAKILEVFNTISQGPTVFTQACREAGVKPVQHPFWENLPFLNIYQSIAPGILHQLYQGVIKHLISWL
ncbi:hypothetical protein L208DRAFT_1188589, partial [Tricholoma matsutake]